MGCDIRHLYVRHYLLVSIHAPAWGATVVSAVVIWLAVKFQSTHPHGVRHYDAQAALADVTFQSTHPHGVRLIPLFALISMPKFQSTHPHGVRHADLNLKHSGTEFQSTHPHGVRPRSDIFQQLDNGFNPRTRMGCDSLRRCISTSETSFQSTHPHGVRLNLIFIRMSTFGVSIHAPAWGATIE